MISFTSPRHDLWAEEMTPQTTIVIPCFNQAAFLPEAIDSALKQSVSVSVVVVDDGSTDDTRSVCERYPAVQYFHQHNQGLAASRNNGLRHVATDYVCFLDADDRLLPEAIETGLRRLTQRSDLAFTSGEHRYIDVAGRVAEEWQRAMPDRSHYEALLRSNYIGMGAAVVFRRAPVEAVGGFDSTLRACEDYDLYLRIAKRYPIDAHSTLVAEYRKYPGTMSSDPFVMLESALTVLQRHRGNGTTSWPRDAWHAGIEFWIDYYGTQIAEQNRTRASRSWIRCGRLAAMLSGMRLNSAGRFCRILLTANRATAA